MPRSMRNAKRQTTAAEARAFLAAAEYGILSTVDAENQPYAVPVNFVYRDNVIYIHSAPAGHKLDNVNANPSVCFTVAGNNRIMPGTFSTLYESVIAFGTAELISGEAVKEPLMMLVEKYDPEHRSAGQAYVDKDYGKTVLIKIMVTRLTGKARRQ